MNELMREYIELVRKLHGDRVADNLTIEFVDGWYKIGHREELADNPLSGQPSQYRKTQLMKTLAILKNRVGA